MSNVEDSLVTSTGEGQGDIETTADVKTAIDTLTADLPASTNVNEIPNNTTSTSEEDTDVTGILLVLRGTAR